MTVKNVEKLEKSRVAVEVEVGAEEFEAAVAKAYLKLRKKVSVPGYRPGKAPRKLIEARYGVIAVNPGSLSYPRQQGRRPTYAVVECQAGRTLAPEIRLL